MNDPHSIGQILWSSDPATQSAILFVLITALISVAGIYVPLTLRAVRLFLLERKLRAIADEASSSEPGAVLDDFRRQLAESPVADTFEEFERRWHTAQLGEDLGRAPIRLIDLFDEKPLLPLGPRRSLLPILPGLFLAIGVFAALYGLIPTLTASESLGADVLSTQVGLALRTTAWGFLCAIGASLASRVLQGAFDARGSAIDGITESVFGSVSPGELAELTRQTQQASLDTLGRELTGFANELNERLDRGLQRIEQSTARSANLVSQEQRGALHSIVGELSLSVRQGVEHHLSELRGALQRAVEHQNSVTGSLAETFQSMVENSKTQDRVARTLLDAARSVDEASRSMRSTSTEMQPVLQHLQGTSESLGQTADRIGDTQLVVARTAEGVRTSLETAATGVNDQREFIEVSLGEIRRAMTGLGEGLGESLQRSLRDIDEMLGKSVTQLRETLDESNETIDRLSSPIRATEGSTREIHLALDRVRNEVQVLGQWLNQAAKPLRSGLAEVDGRAEEIGRSMAEFNNHARQIDKTMEALRHEIHEESRRLQGAGSDLSRRLQQNADAVGLLESTTSDAARRSRVEPSSGRPRKRKWSPSPSDRDFSSATSRARRSDAEDASLSASAAPLAGHLGSDFGSHTEDEDRFEGELESPAEAPATLGGATLGSSETQPQGASGDDTAAGQSAEHDRETSFRVGAPRAQGPDPYARFDQETDEAPSNVRHFPTADRELSQDLKLSELLRPRNEDSDEIDAADDDPNSKDRS